MITVLLLGCSSDSQPLTVLAASSLTESFTALEHHLETADPTLDVVVSFAGSQTLATQVRNGIRADIIANASPTHLDALAAEGLIGTPRPFATAGLSLVVAEGSATDLASLPDVDRVVVGAPGVPVGAYTDAFLDRAEARFGADWRARVEKHVVSRELSVRLVLAKVALGEADAAIVYTTDPLPDGLRSIAIPDALQPEIRFVQAPLKGASPRAEAWLVGVESPPGREILDTHGFGSP